MTGVWAAVDRNELVTAGVLVAALCASWIGTGLVRHYALSRSVLDVPNHRSSHAVPIPRGGGLAIAVLFLTGALVANRFGVVPERVALAVVGGGVLIAAVGWWDDHQPLPARWRAVAHFAAAGWAVLWLGGMPSLNLGMGDLQLGPLGSILAIFGTVWFTNLYNFMDGIDGLAAGEAVTVGIIGGAILWAADAAGLSLLAFLVAAASAGFLLWNWAPAKIFMGDVGSSLLGFLFATLALASERQGAVPLLAWIVLLGVFVFDSTVTLIRRVARGERWYDAHQSHAYQRATRIGLTHRNVSVIVLSLNVALGALSALGWHRQELLPLILLSSMLLLAILYAAIERLRPM